MTTFWHMVLIPICLQIHILVQCKFSIQFSVCYMNSSLTLLLWTGNIKKLCDIDKLLFCNIEQDFDELSSSAIGGSQNTDIEMGNGIAMAPWAWHQNFHLLPCCFCTDSVHKSWFHHTHFMLNFWCSQPPWSMMWCILSIFLTALYSRGTFSWKHCSTLEERWKL